tara:strand:+ start:1032 stop:1307 length:276 start_codon:yes stop_codon:yes gene_type:complete
MSTIANTTLQLGDSAIKIASALTGKTVRYLNQKHSSITPDGVRTFKIKGVEEVFMSKQSGRRCIKVHVKDIDDGGETKHRTLHLSGISSIN